MCSTSSPQLFPCSSVLTHVTPLLAPHLCVSQLIIHFLISLPLPPPTLQPSFCPRPLSIVCCCVDCDTQPRCSSGMQVRLVERLHLDFVRAGARFDSASQARYAEIMGRLAELTTLFSQNVLGDETAYTLVLKEADLTGCPPDLVAAARQAAVERNKAEDEYVITLSRSLVEPFLTFSDRRDLREEAWQAWTKRGELDPERDNHPIIKEVRQNPLLSCPVAPLSLPPPPPPPSVSGAIMSRFASLPSPAPVKSAAGRFPQIARPSHAHLLCNSCNAPSSFTVSFPGHCLCHPVGFPSPPSHVAHFPPRLVNFRLMRHFHQRLQ